MAMTLEQAARGAIRPWFSLDAVAEEWERMGYPVVTSEELADCLNCKYPKCIDCKGGGTGNPVGRPRWNAVQVDGQESFFGND